MSKVYLHHYNTFNKLIKLMIGLLSVFLLFGFYKNGISLYMQKAIKVYEMFNPILFTLISLLVTFIFCKINKEHFLGYRLLTNILISLCTLFNTNILIFIVLICLVNFLSKYIKANPVAMYMVLLIIISFIFNKYTFDNLLEQTIEYNFVFIDYIFGKGTGGVSNTFLLMSIISLVILICNIEYKSQITILSILTYYLFIIIYLVIKGSFNPDLLLNSNILFAFIFIAPLSLYSPYSKGGGYLYGIALGLLTFLFSFIAVSAGVYISILALSFIHKLFDKFITKNNNLVEVL